MLKNPWVKNILSALAVAAVGFVLLNLTFLLFAAVAWGIAFYFGGIEMARSWIGPVSFGVSSILIATFTWLIFRSKWPVLVKAIYLTVPVAVVLVLTGIALYRWPVASYSVGGLLTIAVLYFFWRTKQPWFYYYAVILVALALLIMALTGQEI